MGGKSGSGNEAALARSEEQQRQERIRQGTQRINSIFDGKPFVSGQVGAGAAYDPTKTYYKADGSVWTPPPAEPTASPISTQPRQQGSERTTTSMGTPDAADPFGQAVAGGLFGSKTEGTGGFTEQFFDNQRQRYIDYAMPQVDDQRNAASKELLFAMDRAGQTEGSARANLAGELQKRYELQNQKVRDDGLAYSTQARTQVEGARGDLIAMLNATGDAEGAANSAVARASALSQPAAYSPITNLFADFTGALGTQAAAERARYYGGAGTPGAARYQTGLFAPRSGAVAVSG